VLEALVDNDILMKGACYGLLDELLTQTVSSTDLLGILGATRFVVAKKIRKRGLRRDRKRLSRALRLLFRVLLSWSQRLTSNAWLLTSS
jgi:hypothetical protein